MARKQRKSQTSDAWKKKKWFKIIAPKILNQKEIGETLALEGEDLVGRRIKPSLRETTGNIRQGHVKTVLRISNVKGDQAYTELVGHEIQRDYIRRIVRRRMSVVKTIVSLKTKDGSQLQITAVTFTRRRGYSTQVKTIRKIMTDILTKEAASKPYEQVMQEIIFGKTPARIVREVKKVLPIRRVEIVKTELLPPPK
jgi:small subunit ribosomal protein S3Ae